MKSNIFKIALTFVLVISANVYANEQGVQTEQEKSQIQNAGRWVTVTGLGNLSSGKDVAKRSALLAAYRKAVNEGGSVEISEFSQLRNFKDVVDIVTKKSRGIIKEYTVESEGVSVKDDDYYQVTIKAFVVDNTKRTTDKTEELKQLVTMIGAPKVLIAVGEQQSGQDQLSIASSQNLVEEVIAARFNSVGYKVVTTADLIGKDGADNQSISLARQGISTYADKLARIAKADFVISGLTQFQVSDMNGGSDVSAKVGTATLSAKVFMPGIGRVLHISNSSKRFMSVQGQTSEAAKNKSISLAAEDVADELRWQTPNILSRQTRNIQIVINKIDYSMADQVLGFLKKLEGVDDVELVNWNKQAGAEYKVKNAFTGPREQDFARALTSKYKKIKLDSLHSHSLVLTL